MQDAVPAGQLPTVRWRKSRASNPTGSCVEIAELPGGTIAVRNSRDKEGTALIYPRTEVAAFLHALKNGEFDALIGSEAPVPGLPGLWVPASRMAASPSSSVAPQPTPPPPCRPAG